MGEPDQTITLEECTQDVRRMATRTALLYHYFVTTLIDHLGEAEARALTAEAIQRYGEHIGKTVRRGVEQMGLSNAAENFKRFADLPSVGWEGEVVETSHGPRQRITYCPLAAVWQELGAEEFGRMYCHVDQAKYRAFNPSARLVHTANVLDGDSYCEFDIQLDPSADVGE
jgi:hypothetical protein